MREERRGRENIELDSKEREDAKRETQDHQIFLASDVLHEGKFVKGGWKVSVPHLRINVLNGHAH